MREIVDRVTHNAFLQGHNDRGWSISFNWLWQYENNAAKLIEGNYDDSDTRTGDDRPSYLPTERTSAPSTSAHATNEDDDDPYSGVGY